MGSNFKVKINFLPFICTITKSRDTNLNIKEKKVLRQCGCNINSQQVRLYEIDNQPFYNLDIS